MCSTRERERDTKVLERVISFSASIKSNKKSGCRRSVSPQKIFHQTKETHVV